MSDLNLLNKYEIDLFTATLPTQPPTVIRMTNHQRDIVSGGNTYYATKYGKWERTTVKSELNSVTEIGITVTAGETVFFPGTSRPILWVAKLFTRSNVQIDTASIALDLTPAPLDRAVTFLASKTVFVGQVTIIGSEPGRSTLTCSDYGYLGQKPWPLLVIQPGCPHTVFDRGCTLLASGFGHSVTLAAGSTPTNIIVTSALAALRNDSLPYSRGFFVPSSGEAKGWAITVNQQTDTTHLELAPFDLSVAAGNTGTLYPGCDGKQTTCDLKFSNLVNFGGFPTVPGPPGALSGTGS
jgi:hypothetical protein